MILKDFYVQIQGNYEETLERLLTEERIIKYVTKFLTNDDYELLVKFLNEKDYPNAFLHVHNLKGISLNLGFSKLASSSSELCELIRHGAPSVDPYPYLDKITKDYTSLIDAIKKEFN